MTESFEHAWERTRPDVDADAAADLLREHWGREGELLELGSQQDRNWLVTDAEGERVVLKIDHAATSAEEVAAQHLAAEAIAAAGLAVAAPIATTDGLELVALDGGAHARLLDFLAGGTFADDPVFGEDEARLLGETAGRVVRALADLEHPGLDRALQWDLRNAATVVTALRDDIADEELRERIRAATKESAKAVRKRAKHLPIQPIHGDLTDDNLIRLGAAEVGVIDLGDVGLGWRVAELAVAIGSVLQRTGSLYLATCCAAEFADHVDLGDRELAVLWHLVRLRGATLVASGENQQRIDPDNAYALERMASERRVFDVAMSIPAEEAEAVIRVALGRPHRRGARRARLADGLTKKAVVALDPAADAFDAGGWLRRGSAEDAIFERVEQRSVAATRWGECRLDRADAPSPRAPRNRALFIEVVGDGPLEIRAPFAGTVASVDDDTLDLGDDRVTLRIRGLRVAALGAVEAGATIGYARRSTDGTSRIRVQWVRSRADETIEWASADTMADDASLRPDPSALLGLRPAPSPVRRTRDERRRRDRVLGRASERFWERPPLLVRGWRQYLVDAEARPLVDLVNNVTAVGHCHPRIERAAADQLRLLNTNSRFLYPEYAEFAEALVERANRTWPGEFDVAVPVNSGSEAVDLALRMARAATGRQDVVVPREAYHGWTLASDAVSTSAFDNPAALDSRPEWVHLVDSPNPYRGAHRGADAAERYLDELRETLERAAADGRPIGAFIMEPVLGNAGGVIPPAGYLAGAYEAVRAQGGLAIADEVQVGYGRLGSHFWGAALAGARPDVITVAKAAGNAYPLGAVITRRQVLDRLVDEGMFFSSAAGTPLSARIGTTVLEIIDDEQLQERAARIGAHFSERMRELQSRQPLIGTVHGTGLYQGVELVRDRETREPATAEAAVVCERLLAHGIIVQPASERQNVLKFKPPLTIDLADIDAFADALEVELARLGAE